MVVQWLEHDEVSEGALPPWARDVRPVLDAGPYQVAIFQEGLRLARRGRFSLLPWAEVLVPIPLDEPPRLLLAAPRRPPRPPWFELGGADLERIGAAVRERVDSIDHGSYRQRGPRRDVLAPDVLLTAVLARDALPGAVEIPAASHSLRHAALLGASIGAAFTVPAALALGTTLALGAAAVGVLGGASAVSGIEVLRKRRAGRVLVLTPDGFVGGLDGQSVRAVAWSGVGRFVAGVDQGGRDALEVYDPAQRLIARVASIFFGAPLEVIVAVAEAYRRRALAHAR